MFCPEADIQLMNGAQTEGDATRLAGADVIVTTVQTLSTNRSQVPSPSIFFAASAPWTAIGF